MISTALVACTHHSTYNNKSSSATPIPKGTNFDIKQNVQQPKPLLRKVKEDIYTSSYDPNPEVIRYDRYILITTTPDDGQKYLLDQIVTINMLGKRKSYPSLTVEQGILNTLKNTGYSLCPSSLSDVKSLLRLPLPHVHFKFGPTKLRDALQMLAGEAYQLTVNDSIRQVCYEPRTTIPEQSKPKVYIEAQAGDYEREHDDIM